MKLVRIKFGGDTLDNGNFMGGYYKLCLMLLKLAYLNLLWMFFILLGVVVLGLFPSTIAMFSIVRQWIRGNTEDPIFKTFWNTYKKEFLKANLLGVSYALIGLILYIDILYFSSPASVVMLALYYFFWLIVIIYILLGVFLFPVYVHYQSDWWKYFKSTILIMIMNPLTVVASVLVISVSGFVLRLLPGLIPFFSGSVIAYVLMLLSYRSFKKVEIYSNKDVRSFKMTNQ